MKTSFLKTIFFVPIFAPILVSNLSCSNNTKYNLNEETQIKLSTFNVSFATDNDPNENYERWVKYFSYTNEEQTEIIKKWKNAVDNNKKNLLSKEEIELAEKLIQIRNVTAIIQYNRPDILLLNEFNNDGKGSKETMFLYQKNYLKYSQSLNSVDGENMQEPIEYPFFESFATNTGLKTGMDLNNNGQTDSGPDDFFGYGYYHGQYAFGLMSMYEIDTDNIRTFQNFLWKDMREKDGKTPVSIPKVTKNGAPNGMKIGDDWFSEAEWNKLRLSSKNHADVPIKVKDKTLHLLISHPIPPVFDKFAEVNLSRNHDEILFWKHYIDNQDFIYDDKGERGGIGENMKNFLILGDMNADNFDSDNLPKAREGIKELTSSKLINKEYVDGKWTPTSIGAQEDKMQNGQYKYNHSYPESRTSVFGLRVDWTLPSWNLNIINTGVYWAGKNQPGHLLFNDPRIGSGRSKDISSDHRLVWTTIKI